MIGDLGVGVKGNGGDIQFACLATAVESLDVLQNMGEIVPTQIDQILRHGIEHEGIVGIGTVAKKKLHRIRAGVEVSRRSVVIVFGDGGGVAGAKDFCLFTDSHKRLIEAVGVAVGAEQCFFQNNASTPFADFVVGWVSEDFGGSTRARIRVGHLWETTACEEFGKSFAMAERGGRVG